MTFSHKIKVAVEDIDQMNHVNNVVYVRYVQEVAEAHWKSIASKNLQREVVWVVLRHEIDYKKPAFLEETLTGETWVEEHNGLKMPRIVVIRNEKGQELVRAKTLWCALDGETHRPKRIDDSLYLPFI